MPTTPPITPTILADLSLELVLKFDVSASCIGVVLDPTATTAVVVGGAEGLLLKVFMDGTLLKREIELGAVVDGVLL